MKRVIGSAVVVLAAANFSFAGVNVDVNTPGVGVHVGTPPPVVVVPPPQPVFVAPARVIEPEYRYDDHRDRGKHKGHYKKYKKHKKHKKDRYEDRD